MNGQTAYYQNKYQFKCDGCSFPMETNQLCDECAEKEYEALAFDTDDKVICVNCAMPVHKSKCVAVVQLDGSVDYECKKGECYEMSMQSNEAYAINSIGCEEEEEEVERETLRGKTAGQLQDINIMNDVRFIIESLSLAADSEIKKYPEFYVNKVERMISLLKTLDNYME